MKSDRAIGIGYMVLLPLLMIFGFWLGVRRTEVVEVTTERLVCGVLASRAISCVPRYMRYPEERER